jgi:hypothetical protein
MKLEAIKDVLFIVTYENPEEGQFLSNCECRACGGNWAAITAWTADLSTLECPHCHACDCEADLVLTGEG